MPSTPSASQLGRGLDGQRSDAIGRRPRDRYAHLRRDHAGVGDETLTNTLTKEVRKELRQFGVHVIRSKLVDFAECKVFKLMTSQADRAGMAHSQFYL